MQVMDEDARTVAAVTGLKLQMAGDVNGGGLGDVRLRGGGYAQVFFSQPLN